MLIPRHASLLLAGMMAQNTLEELGQEGYSPLSFDEYLPKNKSVETESHKKLRQDRKKDRQQRRAAAKRNRK